MADLRVTAGFVLFLVAFALGRVVTNRALATLTADEKARLLDGFAQRRVYGVLIIAVLVAAYGLLKHFAPDSPLLSDPGYFGTLILLVLVSGYAAYQRLVTLSLPTQVTKAFVVAKGLQLLGFGLFLVLALTG